MQQKIQFLGGPLDGHSTECDVPFGMTTVILDVIIKRSRVSYMFEIKPGGTATAEYMCRADQPDLDPQVLRYLRHRNLSVLAAIGLVIMSIIGLIAYLLL